MASAPFQLDYCEFACTAGSECEESSFSSEEEDIDPPSIPLLDESATESRNETGRPHGDIFSVPSDAHVASIQTQTFAGSSGVKMQFPENATVFDIFQAFLPENFVQKIVEYTNIYASLSNFCKITFVLQVVSRNGMIHRYLKYINFWHLFF